jgi:hypothetical protein
MEDIEVQQDARLTLPVKPKNELIPSNKEEVSTLERTITALGEEISNLTDLKDAIEMSFNRKNDVDDKFQSEVTAYFNSLRKQFEDFNEKFSREIDYARELDLKIQNNEYRGQIYLLDKSLNEERAKLTISIDSIEKTVKETLQSVNDKCCELKSVDNIIQENMMKFRTDSFATTENEYKALKLNCETLLKNYTESAQKNLEAVKKNTIDFLAQCEKENKELIAKVPIVKGNLTAEGWLVIAFGCIGVASLILQILIK